MHLFSLKIDLRLWNVDVMLNQLLPRDVCLTHDFTTATSVRNFTTKPNTSHQHMYHKTPHKPHTNKYTKHIPNINTIYLVLTHIPKINTSTYISHMYIYLTSTHIPHVTTYNSSDQQVYLTSSHMLHVTLN